MSWFDFALFFFGIIALPRIVLAFFFMQSPGWVGAALAALSLYESGKDFAILGEFIKNARTGFKVIVLAILGGLKRSFVEHVKAWFDLLFLALRGKQFFVVEVVEIEKIVYRDRPVAVEVPILTDMTRANACDVLGCAPDADKVTVDRKYRSILQKVHPDHGGSVFLTAIVNQARAQLRK